MRLWHIGAMSIQRREAQAKFADAMESLRSTKCAFQPLNERIERLLAEEDDDAEVSSDPSEDYHPVSGRVSTG